MKHLWSSPNEHWSGFQPVPYWLDVKKVLALPLTQEDSETGSKKTISTTVGEIYKKLSGQHVETESSVDTEITTETGKLVVTGPSFNREILEILLSLRQDRTNGLRCFGSGTTLIAADRTLRIPTPFSWWRRIGLFENKSCSSMYKTAVSISPSSTQKPRLP